MPNISDLHTAVEDGNLGKIQELLQVRDDRGVPFIDINNTNTTTILHLICFIQRDEGLRINQARTREMFEYIVNLRDNAGNPIANPNTKHVNAGNLLTAIVDLNDLYLLQLVLDMRTNQGEMVANVYAGTRPGHFWSPLRRAIYLNKIDMVRALVDARKADGTPLLTQDQIRNDLRGATSNHFDPRSAYISGNECVNYLNHYLGQRTDQRQPVNLQQPNTRDQQQLINPPITPIPNYPTLPDAVNQFNTNVQNTHDPAVTQTAKGSLIALERSYGKTINEDVCVNEIKTFIMNYDYSTLLNSYRTSNGSKLTDKEKKKETIEFFDLLKTKFSDVHS